MNQRVATRLLFLIYLFSASMYLTQAQQSAETTLNSQTDKSYRIETGDLLAINIFSFTHPYRESRVDCNGMISLPSIGKIKAGGQTVEEFKKDLGKNIASTLYDPNSKYHSKNPEKIFL